MCYFYFYFLFSGFFIDGLTQTNTGCTGNARLFGLEHDLGLHGNDYQLCVALLFVTYIPFELPTPLILKKVRPNRLIPTIAICWGLSSLCTGFVQNKGQLIATRMLIGLFEAGYFPAVLFYLTFFYRRRELGMRLFLVFASSAVAGACGGLIAYGVGYMDGMRNMSAWRWLVILEGIPTLLLGFCAYFVLANDPLEATFLTEREKYLVRVRRDLDRPSSLSSLASPSSPGPKDEKEKKEEKIQWDQILSAWKDWKVWTMTLAQIGVNTMIYGYVTFIPTIIHAMGYSNLHAQLLTIPCYAVGALSYLVAAYLSDRSGYRGYFAVGGCVVACTGYAILLGTPRYGPHAQYAGCLIVAAGMYVASGLPLSWLPNNLPSDHKRAAGQGTCIALGNCAGIISSFIYRTQDKPTYYLGHGLTLGFVFASGCLYALTTFLLRRENRRRDQGERDYLLEGKTPEQIERLGEYHPEYRYLY